MKRARIIVLAILCLAATGTLVHAAQPSFYLSTDRIFSSQEDVILRVEGRDLRQLALRVYKIEDPLAFFTSRPNPYQIREEGARLPGARQLMGLFLNGVRNEVAEGLKRKASYTNLPPAMRDGIKEILRVDNHSVRGTERGYLQRYPLLREINLDIPEQKQDWVYHLVRLPIFEKGVYLIEGVGGREAGYTVVIISDLAIVSRHAADTAVYFTSDRISGKGERARLTLFRPAEMVGTALVPNQARLQITANAEGLARHNNRAWLDGRVYAFAEGANGVALQDVTFYPSSSFGVPSTKAYIYTERPLYMPGQTVYFRAVLRDYNAGYRPSRLTREGNVPIELYSPSGKLISQTEGVVGEFATLSGEWAIPEDAESGIWRLVVVHEERRYETPFKVEHYVKPPFEVTVAMDKPSYSFGEEVRGRVSARYFFGDAVRGAVVQYIVYRSERVQSQEAGVPFGWYLQDNEFRNVREERVFEGRGETDGDGVFAFTFNANANTLRNESYSFRVEARITDRSRRLVRGSGSFSMTQGRFWLRLHAPKEYFVPGEKAAFTVSAHGYDGQPAAADYTARITYFRWDSVHLSQPAERVVRFERRYSLPGGSKFEFVFDNPGHYQIEIIARDTAGNAITTSQFVWVAGNASKFVVHESGLRIIADKKLYARGETAELLAISPVPDMQMLYTIEGDTILESGVLSLQGNSHLFKQRITERMAPNAWFVVHAVFNDRVYTARQQLIAPPREKFLDINVSGLKENYRPGEQVSGTVEVRDHNNRGVRAALSMAVVDQAIFALQPRMAIDIERFFYHARRNTVVGASSFYTRFYGYAEEDKLALARHLRADTALADLSKGSHRGFDESRRGDFNDLAYWNAEIITDNNGRASFSFALPDNITAWDMDLVALDAADRVGSKRDSFIARKDFFIRSVLPPVLFEQENALLTASVHNLTAARVDATVRLDVKNGEVLNNAEQSIMISAQGERLVTWRVRASQVGKMELEFSVRGPENDSEVQTIDVKPFAQNQFRNFAGPLSGPNRAITREFALPAGAHFDNLDSFGRFAVDASGGLTIRVSPSLINLIEDSMRYLADYPYGCVEQTLSRFVPNLLVQRLMEEYPFRDPYLQDALPDMASMGLDRLRAMQLADGSWGWFANDMPDLFMTAYAVYSLTLARNMGYWQETEAMLERGTACLVKGLREQGQLDPAVRAFALFALRQQNNEMDSMVAAALENTPRQERLARVFLANAALGTNLQEQALRVAEELLQDRPAAASGASTGGHILNWKDDDNFIDALLIRVFTELQPPRAQEICRQLIAGLLARRQGNAWRSTFDTAFILNAFLDYTRTWPPVQTNSDIRISVNGTVLALNREGLGFEARAGSGLLRAGRNVLEVRGGTEMYYNAALRYAARQESFEAQNSASVSIARSYHLIETRRDGRPVIARELRGDLPHGRLILVRLNIRAARALDYVMIEDPFISGCEFVSERDDNWIQGIKLNAWLSHQREADRVVFFLRAIGAGETQVHYLIRPYLEGTYRVLPATVGSMYFPDSAATSASARIRVVRE
jgi:uncharacterized protein YfaS (alpha-2-macroglobulin family)